MLFESGRLQAEGVPDMLTIILNILKILGIILLVILGVLLVAILLILFYPICYKVEADRQPDFINRADVKAWWLFGLIRARFCYPNPGKLKVKLLFFTIYESEAISASTEDEQDDSIKSDTERQTADNQTNQTNFSIPVDNKKTSDNTKPKQNAVREISDDDSKIGPIEKMQYTFRKFCDKIKEIRENIEYYKEVLLCDDTKELLKYAFMRLGKILKSIRPRKLRADIHFGTGSPDTTGYVFALYGMICPHLGKNVFVTPDFEQTILIGELFAKGHITLFKVLWNGLMIVKDHRLWELKDKLTKNK